MKSSTYEVDIPPQFIEVTCIGTRHRDLRDCVVNAVERMQTLRDVHVRRAIGMVRIEPLHFIVQAQKPRSNAPALKGWHQLHQRYCQSKQWQKHDL